MDASEKKDKIEILIYRRKQSIKNIKYRINDLILGIRNYKGQILILKEEIEKLEKELEKL